jgi:transcriptional regulator with XRE-family HTH domain
LGVKLRSLRKADGISGQALGDLLRWSQSKISKIETGRVIPSVDDIEAISQALQITEEVKADLVARSKILSAKLRTWRNLRSEDLLYLQKNIREIESNCKTIRVFQPFVVPGLLQTAEYSRQVFLRVVPDASDQEISAAIAGRLDRQQILFDESKELLFIMTEAVFRTRIASKIVMLGQIDRLIALTAMSHLRLSILPFKTELPVLANGSFVIFDDHTVLIETSAAEMVLKDEQDVTHHTTMFNQLLECSLSGLNASHFLRQLAIEIGDNHEPDNQSDMKTVE